MLCLVCEPVVPDTGSQTDFSSTGDYMMQRERSEKTIQERRGMADRAQPANVNLIHISAFYMAHHFTVTGTMQPASTGINARTNDSAVLKVSAQAQKIQLIQCAEFIAGKPCIKPDARGRFRVLLHGLPRKMGVPLRTPKFIVIEKVVKFSPGPHSWGTGCFCVSGRKCFRSIPPGNTMNVPVALAVVQDHRMPASGILNEVRDRK